MSPRRDVDQIVFVIRCKGVFSRKIMERPKHLFKIPGIFQMEFMQSNVRFRRNRLDIRNHGVGKRKLFRLVKQLKPRNQQIFMLANGDTRPPSLPTILPRFTSVEQSSQDSKYDNRPLSLHYITI